MVISHDYKNPKDALKDIQSLVEKGIQFCVTYQGTIIHVSAAVANDK